MWNPFKGGRYDLSKTATSLLPGGERAGIYVHGTAAPQAESPQQTGNDFSPMQQLWEDQQNPTNNNGAGSQVQSNTAYINGQAYNLNDPGQFQAYVSQAESILNSDFDAYRGKAERLRDEDIAEAKAQEDEVLYNIDRALKKIGEQEGQYNTDFVRSIADLAEGFNQGSARRQSFYASVAPRVYQSSQGTSQQYAENKFKEGKTRYEEDRTRATQGFNEAREDYGRSRVNAENQFNLFKTRREAQAQDEIAEVARSTREKKDQMRAGFRNYSDDMRASGAPNSSRWSGVNFQGKDLNYSPSQVNLNDLMQFIKFQPAGVGMGSMGGQKSQAIATPEAGGQSLGNYMGYQEQPQEESTINQYKKGNSLY